MRATTGSISCNATALLRVLAIALMVATILAVMGASQSQAWYVVNHGTAPPWSQSLLWSATQWYAWAVFVPIVVLAGLRFSFASGASVVGRVLLHTLFAIAFALAHLLLQTAILWFLIPGGQAFLGSFGTGALTLVVTTLQWELLSYAVVLAATHIALYLRRAQQESLTRRELETQAARAQLDALKRQMQPHFLFNALNALVSMQHENSPEQRFTIRLAEILRLLLEGNDAVSATLANELLLVEAYLHVERVRLGARLCTVIDVPDCLSETLLPSLILQPLVENAVTHGVARDPAGGEIRIEARRAGREVIVEITNTCHTRQGSPAYRGNGIALDNCRQRVALMYGASARFEAGPMQTNGFRAAITVPAMDVGVSE